MSQEFRMKNIDETKKYFIEEIKQNELISKKHKVCKTLSYIEHLLILVSTVTGCVSISVFASLVGVSEAIASSAVRVKVCAVIAVIKNYRSIINKNKEET